MSHIAHTEEGEVQPQPKKSNAKRGNMLIIAIVIIAASLAGVSWLFSQRKVAMTPQAASQQATPAEVNSLVAKIARHIVVKDEQPTIATVDDPDTLRGQNPIFYQDAKKGDRLFVWTDKAVLYSPTEDKILAVLPINYPVAAPTAPTVATTPSINTTTTAQQVADTAVIEILNGSGKPGLGKMFGAKLKSMGMNATVTGNAKETYAYTVIVKASKSVSAKTLSTLTTLTGGTVESLPSSEASFTGDVLVIIGSNYAQ